MFQKQSRSELKAFGLLLGFMAFCGTFGTIFFSKIVLLLSNVSFLGNLFLFFVFLTVVGGIGFGLYHLTLKIIPMISALGSNLSPYTKKVRANGFIASFKINKKKEK